MRGAGSDPSMRAGNLPGPTGGNRGEEVFRVQNFEHQMLAEHCTNGIDVFVTNRRIILLDCQVVDIVH